ncbi:MAG: hypothetical protein ACPGVG_18395 [Mycobacterium sp.]
MATPLIGTGTVITWSGATGFFAEVLDANWTGRAPTILETTHMGTTGARTHDYGSLVEQGQIAVRMRHDAAIPPDFSATGTCLVTWSDGEKVQAANALLAGYDITVAIEEYVEATATLKLSGAVSYPT